MNKLNQKDAAATVLMGLWREAYLREIQKVNGLEEYWAKTFKSGAEVKKVNTVKGKIPLMVHYCPSNSGEVNCNASRAEEIGSGDG